MRVRRSVAVAVAVAAGLAAATAGVLPLAAPSAGAAPVVALNPCADPDNGRPVVTDIAVSPADVSTAAGPQTVDVSVAVLDTGGPGAASGVTRVWLTGWASSQGAVRGTDLAPGADGRWHGQVRIPVGVGSQTLTPTVEAVDAAGNVGYATAGQDGLAAADIHVTGVADRVAPRLTGLRLSRTAVDTRRHARTVRVTTTLSSGAAAVTRVVVTAGGGPLATVAHLHGVAGTATHGTWRGRLHVATWVGTERRQLVVEATDVVGRTATYDRPQLTRLARHHHVDQTLQVTSRADRWRPAVGDLRLSTTSVDVSTGDAQVVATVTAGDAGSGVAGVRLWLIDPADGRSQVLVPLHRTDGTARHGTWSAVLTVPHCGTAPGTLAGHLRVVDRAALSRSHDKVTPVLAVADTDTLGPRAVRTSSPTGVPTLTFDEDTTGITASSAVVHADAYGTVHGSGPLVDGTWRCADATGAAVDCATGAVRRADFTPSTTPPAGQLLVELNPEHVLQVTDLAGNPVGRRYLL